MMTTTRLKNFTEKMRTKKLKIILGPTAVGKTDYSIETALKYESPVISCDSRQIYKEMSIGTAVPDASQLAAVKHYFIHSHTVTELYTAGKYEIEALGLINRLFDEGHDTLVMAGGSGFYVDALVNGLDDFPAADQELRNELMARLKAEGVESLRLELKALDPESYATIDVANGQRVVRALEVCLMTGKPFSSFKTSAVKKRDFEIEKIGLTRPRDVLYDRINRRVINMIDDGLVDEVRSVMQYRDLAALQTVGYKEIFDWFDFLDGKVSTEGWGPTTPGDGPVTSLDRAIELIQRNTRRYAKRQLSYWGRDKEIKWLEI
jgi:tRNA dimethylallyltransferase